MAHKRKEDFPNGSQPKRSRLGDSNPDLSQNPDFHDRRTMDQEAEVGIIEAISVRNFMCHSKLEFSFGPHVNFLIGHNGSGKSAVLTAMIAGLGGKASATNRGTSVKNFIKSGKRTAEIMIKLRNRGPDAYKHDIYGDSIIIERKLCQDGGGSYKLKSSKSNVVISRKDELSSILDHFNIQVENPVAILTQEASKTFLHSRSPHDKYKFFLKATQLEQTKQDYVAAEESKRVAAAVMKEKEKTLPDIEKEVLHWKQKFDACGSLDALKDKISNLKKELAWAIIGETERSLEPRAKELKAEKLRTPKFDQKVDEMEAKVKEVEQEYDRLQDEVKRLGEEAEAVKPRHVEAKNIWLSKKTVLKKFQDEHRKICSERESVASDKKQIEQRIKELKQKDHNDYDEQRRVRQERILHLEHQMSEHRARSKTLEMDIGQFQSAISKIEHELSQARLEEKSLISEIQRTEAQLRNYESARTDKLSRYGAWMPAAIKKIDEAFNRGRFQKKPIGPIGANIAVRDPKWALAVEVCLGATVKGFCVDNHNDERVLEEIFSQVCTNKSQKPTIITSAYQNILYNVPKNTTRYPTVLEMLEISDPVTANFIVDQRGIEGILLFEDSAAARNIMKSNPPHGFREAFTIEGDQMLTFPTFRMYTAEKSTAQFLTASLEDVIKQFRDDLQQQKLQLQQLKVKAKKFEDELNRHSAEKQKNDLTFRKLRQNINTIDMEIKELKNFEEPQPIDVSMLETEAEELGSKLEELDARVAAELEHVSKARNDQNEAEKNFHDVDQLIHSAAESLDPFKSRLDDLGTELETAKQHRKHYIMKKKEHEKRVQQLQTEFNAKMADIESDRQKALQICDEMRTRRTAQNIENEIKQIEKQIQAEERIRGDRNEITQKYHEKRQAFEKIRREVLQINNFLRKLDESMIIRNTWFQRAKRSLTLRTKLYFMNNLAARNYCGKLNVSHKNETIEPAVYPKAIDGGTESHGTSNKSLSGGERSFSTACFILALWDVMDSPFRCLDEYDVYMDMVNRRITMDMMMRSATTKKGSQFIFLSPLDMSGVLNPGNLDVKIFELHPPERGIEENAAEEEDDN